jgi:uncharacterized membrane protein (UPF0127 family)
MNRNIIILLAVITLVILIGVFYNNLQNNTQLEKINPITQLIDSKEERVWKTKLLQIGDKNYEIFLTENEEDMKKGLSAFEDIKDSQGMLFEFEIEDFHSFWMKDMKFDIDMIFLDKEMKVVHIFENVRKDTYKNQNDYKIFIPKLKSKYVIEIKSGEVKKNKLKLGDIIKL